MISMMHDADRRCVGIELRPSVESPSASLLVMAFLLVSLPLLAEGTYFAALGFWPVLTYALATVALFAYGLRVAYWRTREREVVLLSDAELAIEKGHRCLEARHVVQRVWAQVILTEGIGDEPLSRLVVRAHGRDIEVGRFLRDQERRELARNLRRWVGAAPASDLGLAA